MSEIKLNKPAFDSMVKAIQSEQYSIASIKIKSLKLSRTNLNRFKKYCQVTENLIKQLNQYEALLEKDIHKIKSVGEEIARKDKELSNHIVNQANGQLEMR